LWSLWLQIFIKIRKVLLVWIRFIIWNTSNIRLALSIILIYICHIIFIHFFTIGYLSYTYTLLFNIRICDLIFNFLLIWIIFIQVNFWISAIILRTSNFSRSHWLTLETLLRKGYNKARAIATISFIKINVIIQSILIRIRWIIFMLLYDLIFWIYLLLMLLIVVIVVILLLWRLRLLTSMRQVGITCMFYWSLLLWRDWTWIWWVIGWYINPILIRLLFHLINRLLTWLLLKIFILLMNFIAIIFGINHLFFTISA